MSIPSPFTSLELNNSEIHSMTSWTLNCIVGGDSTRKINISAFEALLYSAAQQASQYDDSSGIPVSFIFGWLDESGNVEEYLSYQGFSLKFSVSSSGLHMQYKITGFASLAIQSSMPVLRIPAITGIVQPSAVLESLARASKATSYYNLDIDHNDAPTLINHGPITTSFNKYVRGTYSTEDDYDSFPGLLTLSKSYSSSRDSGGLHYKYKKLSQVLNNSIVTPIANFLQQANGDTTPQLSSFSYWVDEPTMTQPGTIHYKSNAGMITSHSGDVLEYGTADTNVFSITGSYDGVAYNISEMRFSQVGFTVDGSGSTIMQNFEVVNSWSSSLADVFQSANIIHDINAVATQFSAEFTVTIPGTTKKYNVAQPVSLIVVSGNTPSPITGIYNIVSVSHTVSNSFTTQLKIKRMAMSAANTISTLQAVFVSGSSNIPRSSFTPTPNIVSTHKVELGEMYPNFEHLGRVEGF
jgi:hypothetical protein